MWRTSVAALDRYLAQRSGGRAVVRPGRHDQRSAHGHRVGALHASCRRCWCSAATSRVPAGSKRRASACGSSAARARGDRLPTMAITAPGLPAAPGDLESAWYLPARDRGSAVPRDGQDDVRCADRTRADRRWLYRADQRRTMAKGDLMPSYFLGRRSSYLYLTFAPDAAVDLDRVVSRPKPTRSAGPGKTRSNTMVRAAVRSPPGAAALDGAPAARQELPARRKLITRGNRTGHIDSYDIGLRVHLAKASVRLDSLSTA